jgi:outer membrane receptor protein involved in Fe transport
VSGGAEYGSGLPFEFTGTPDQALAQYGQQMVNRVDFADGRIRSTLSVDISAGADLYKPDHNNKEPRSLRLQADVENLNNRLNVLDFAGLFSASAIAPPRSYFLRLAATF